VAAIDLLEQVSDLSNAISGPSDSSHADANHSGPDMLALDVDNVQKKFGTRAALDGVSFHVKPAERLALLGPNGAGKTTLVRAICGRVRLDGGQIQLFGKSIDQPLAMNRLGVVPQELAIYPDMTAEENLKVFAKLHGLKRQEVKLRVEWALEWIGLVDRRRDLIRTFSGGMKRRVNIACGVMHDPGVLLLDEPTVGVDPQSRERIFDMLDELHASGTSIVLTTHHLDEAQSRCDRIVIVDHGKTIAEGDLQSLIRATVGGDRQLMIHTDRRVDLDGEQLQLDVRWDDAQDCLVGTIQDAKRQLPVILNAIQEQQASLVDIEMHHPNLSHVFLHLTGRQLRE
jgi:ABC-2 type transport system ATP-binding protein